MSSKLNECDKINTSNWCPLSLSLSLSLGVSIKKLTSHCSFTDIIGKPDRWWPWRAHQWQDGVKNAKTSFTGLHPNFIQEDRFEMRSKCKVDCRYIYTTYIAQIIRLMNSVIFNHYQQKVWTSKHHQPSSSLLSASHQKSWFLYRPI